MLESAGKRQWQQVQAVEKDSTISRGLSLNARPSLAVSAEVGSLYGFRLFSFCMLALRVTLRGCFSKLEQGEGTGEAVPF